MHHEGVTATNKDIWSLNTLTTLLATAETTDGAMGAWVQRITPAGNVPLHVHSREDEAFYILEGSLTFYMGEERRPVGPGDFVFAPRGIPHQFTVDSDEVQMLVVVTPGGFESFFEELGTPAGERSLPPVEAPDMEKLAQMASRYGLELLGPPLS